LNNALTLLEVSLALFTLTGIVILWSVAEKRKGFSPVEKYREYDPICHPYS